MTQTVSPLGGQRIIHQAISYRNACNWGGGGGGRGGGGGGGGGGGRAGGRGRSADGR